jgi:hypothetical protein
MTAASQATAVRTSELYPSGIPRLNHVAMSVPPELLAGAEREELLGFYRQCFGWEELVDQGEEGRVAVLTVGHWDQFVFLHAEDAPMTAVRMDHFGVAVHSEDDFDTTWARVAARAAGDDRVDVVAPHVDDFEVLKLHAFYVRFRLPLMVEVQYWQLV